MLKKLLGIRILAIFLFLEISPIKAQSIAYLEVEVVDQKSRELLDSAEIKNPLNQTLGFTNNGIFTFSTTEIGFIDLKIEKNGYLTAILNHVHLIPNKTTRERIELQATIENIDEVEIIGHHFESSPNNPVSSYYFTREEINMNPGAQGDIFRAIGMLPGVSSSGGVYSAIAVRGQGVRDNVYMVDGIPCTELGHLEGNSFFNDPNGGRFSIFAPRVIEGAEFQSGGFSSLYGRRSASYLGLTVKEGNTSNIITDGQIDLLGLNVNIEGPLKGIKNTQFFFSGRYQNFLALVNVVGLKDIGLPRYGDFIFKTNTQLGSRLKLNTLFIVAPERYTRDSTHVNADKNLNLVYMPDFIRNKIISGATLKYQINRQLQWTNIAYYTGYFSDIRVDKAIPDTDSNGLRRSYNLSTLERLQEQTYQDHKGGVRSLIDYRHSDKLQFSAGLESDFTLLQNERVQNGNDTQFIYYRGQNFPQNNFLVLLPDFVNTNQTKQAFNHSAYGELRYRFMPQLQLNLGYRADYTGFSEQLVGAPRISASWKLNGGHTLGIAAGRYYQDPVYSDIADQATANILKMERTDMWVLSYKKRLWRSWRATVEVWQKDFSNMVVRPQAGYTFVTNGGSGYGNGMDLQLNKKLTQHWGGMFSYSLMESKRTDVEGGVSYPFAFDQTHQVNFLLNYKVNSRMLVSVKYRYATGKPSDGYVIYENVLNDRQQYRYSKEITDINASRLPSFRSLDFRINYDFRFRGIAFTGFMDIVNVANKQIPNFENFNGFNGRPYYDGLAIFPTGGLKFEF